MPNLRRFAALAAITLLATVSVIAPAQITPMTGKKATLRGYSAPATSQTAEAPMNRLIIQFKDQAMDKTGAFNAVLAKEHVKALNTSSLFYASGKKVALTYFKSITPQSHVALTDEKLSRSALLAIARQFAQDSRVEYVEIDEKVYPHFVPNDTFLLASNGICKILLLACPVLPI